MRMLRFAMAHRWVVVLASLAALVSIVPLGKRIPSGMFPEDDRAAFQVNVRAPEGTSLQATALVGERIARQIRRTIPGVVFTTTTIGDDDRRTPNLAGVYVQLSDPTLRRETQFELMARVRDQIVARQSKTLRIEVSEVDAFGSGLSQAAVQYGILGPDLAKLGAVGEKIAERLRRVPGAVDVDTSLVLGKPSSRSSSTARRPPTSACRSPTSPARCSSWSAA